MTSLGNEYKYNKNKESEEVQMKTWKVKRFLSTYTVDATTRSKAKYAAYKVYRKSKRKPLSFFPWVVGVSKIKCVG